MADSHRALRGVLVAGGVALLVVVVGIIGSARLRARHFLRGLPGRLGADIRQETDGFTYSQSVKGRTVFTVHAAKEIQRGDGTVTLHDVGILLYGARPGQLDRIHGNEFVYDQAHGTLRAEGEVFLDLAGASAAAGPSAAAGSNAAPPVEGGSAPAEAARVLHVRTSALVFRERERSASTDAPLELTAGALRGRAIGATFDGENGTVVLRSAVALEEVVGGSARNLEADRAEIHHVDNTVLLEHVRYAVVVRGGEERVSADHAVVRGSPNGQPLAIEAQGHVLGRMPGGATVAGERGTVRFTEAGLPRELQIDGGVRLLDDGGLAGGELANGRQPPRHPATTAHRTGSADSAQLAFDAAGQPAHGVLEGAVELRELGPGDRRERRLNARRVELSFAPGGPGGRAVLRKAVAFGEGAAVARLRMSGEAAGGGSETTEIAGDTVDARFVPGGAGRDLRIGGLTAHGHTGLERTSGPAGSRGLLLNEKSTADTLELEFADGPYGAPTLGRATERGSVEILREAVGKGPGRVPEVEHARAQSAAYEPAPAGAAAPAAAGTLTLTGAAEMVDDAKSVAAERIVLDRGTGDASAEGGVRLRVGGVVAGVGTGAEMHATREPIHALGAHAILHRATGVLELFGGAAAEGSRARMWGSGAQVEAPVLVFEAGPEPPAGQPAGYARAGGRLLAHGAPGDDDAVHAVLPPEAPGAGAGAGAPRAATIVRSGEMVLTEAHDALPETIVFRRRVRVASGQSSLHADMATVTLATVTLTSGNAGPGTSRETRQIREIVADGAVALDEPGRKARGTKLVYTAGSAAAAGNGSYLLTGGPGAPPRLDDADRGTVTGSAIRFTSADRRAVASGGPETGGRVHTETRGGGRP